MTRPLATGRVLVGILALALALRLLLLVAWHGQGRDAAISSDSHDYQAIAQSLGQGKGFELKGRPTSRRPPVYPVFLAAAETVLPFPTGVRVVQAVLGVLTCLVLFLLGREIFGPAVGLVGAALLGVDYYAVRQTASILPECVFVFVLLTAYWLLARAHAGRRALTLGAAGAVLGIAVLTKDVLTLFVPVLALWPFLWGDNRLKASARAAAWVLAAAAVLSPWIVRNSLLQRRAVGVTSSAGHTLYIANNPLAKGGTTGGEWELKKDVVWPPDPQRPPLFTAEADRYLFRKAVEFIVGHPGQFLRLAGRKLVNMWRPYQTDSPVLSKWAMGLSYGFVMAFAIPGIVLTRRRWRALFPIYALIAYMVLLHAVLISQIRYRYPVMPFFMLFAAATLVELGRRAGLTGKRAGDAPSSAN